MRSALAFSFCLFVLNAAPAGGNPKDARVIIERAVQAQGGLDKLEQIKASRSRIKGYFHNYKEHFFGEVFNKSPDKLRMILTFKGAAAGGGPRTLIVNGDKGWLQFDGMIEPFDEEAVRRTKKEAYADRVATLVPLLKEKQFVLAVHGKVKVDDIAAVSVKVSAEGKPEVLLYFSNESGLLIKEAHRRIDPDSNQDVLQETYYRSYRLLDSSTEDEQLLKEAKIPTDGPGLLAYLQGRIPSEAARKEIEDLVRQLGDGNFGKRQKASAALIAAGPRAAPFLQQARKLPDKEIARRAEMCLQKIGDSPDLNRVAAAVRLITVRRPPGAAEVLLKLYPWAPGESTAEDILAGLASLTQEGKKADPGIEQGLTDPDPRIREAAAAALGRDRGAYLNRLGRKVLLPGVRLPRLVHIFRDGQRRMDYETIEYHVVNGLDEKLFKRPE
jgi:hypothetical protein